MLLILFIILLIIYIVVAYFIKIFPFTPKPMPVLTPAPIISLTKAPSQSPKLTAIQGSINKANNILLQYNNSIPSLVAQFNNIPIKYNAYQQSRNEISITTAMDGLNSLITIATQLQTLVDRANTLLQTPDISNSDNTITAITSLTNLLTTSLAGNNIKMANDVITRLNNTPLK